MSTLGTVCSMSIRNQVQSQSLHASSDCPATLFVAVLYSSTGCSILLYRPTQHSHSHLSPVHYVLTKSTMPTSPLLLIRTASSLRSAKDRVLTVTAENNAVTRHHRQSVTENVP